MIGLSQYNFEILRKDDAFALYRGRNDDGAVLVVSPVGERPSPENLQRLEREYSLRNELDSEWAVQPLAIGRYWDRPVLVLTDPGAQLLEDIIDQPLDVTAKLCLAIAVSQAIGRLHHRNIVHKDIRPAYRPAN